MKIPYSNTIKSRSAQLKAPLWPLLSSWYQLRFSPERIQESIERTNLFFVLSTGRSGTQFLSSFLQKIDNSVLVLHEPDFHYDAVTLEKCKNSEQYAFDYIRNFRKYTICRRLNAGKFKAYCEVTGTLRFHAEALQKVFPRAKILMMSRDGRDVVRSVMGWNQFYGKGSKGAYNLSPISGDPFYTKWDKMGRFEKICWSWQNSNKCMLQSIPPDDIFQFEKILIDFEYFKSNVSDRLHLAVSEQAWCDAVSRKSPNSTKKYGFPHWAEWSEEQKEGFAAICGSTMQKLGYKMDI